MWRSSHAILLPPERVLRSIAEPMVAFSSLGHVCSNFQNNVHIHFLEIRENPVLRHTRRNAPHCAHSHRLTAVIPMSH